MATKEFDTKYDPKKVEDKWYKYWMDEKLFEADVKAKKEKFVIVIPPPNITGVLHMGHALNNTIQDILIRWKRMQGYSSLWVPGVDHAGIATQNVVEKYLASKNLTKEKIGREKFLETVWEWKEKYGDSIINQLKKLGSSCDWSRERFTMDEGCSKAVREEFVSLYEDGLIYRAKFIINWCPRCKTALSDIEVEHEDLKGKLYHINYPLKDGSSQITVATTRPETMLGDTAVAVNPGDKKYKRLKGKTLILPLVAREIPIIEDDVVDVAFGTGAVKVTPAHDPNDFMISERHGLEKVVIMDEAANMINVPDKYKSMDRYKCRDVVIKDLAEQGFLVKEEEHFHAVGHCYRCRTVVEPYLSDQWFVKMKELAKEGIKVVKKGKVKFVPERWRKVYLNWMENVRDWCISRQIWWGHRIPVWYCDDCGEVNVEREDPKKCKKCSSKNLRQDEDVLDTWFSSALWPFSTLGWPDKTEDLKKFYPTSVLVTGFEIIYFWVARMIMTGLKFMKDVPFHTVYIHGIVRDDKGRKMSKSMGNVVDPLDLIDKYGADALRFSLAGMVSLGGQDIFLCEERIQGMRNFSNKLWNASRFVFVNLAKLEEEKGSPDFVGFESLKDTGKVELRLPDRWIFSKLNKVIGEVTKALDVHRYNEAASKLYEFTWDEFCSWYIELAKLPLYGKEDYEVKDDSFKSNQIVLSLLCHVLDKLLRLLHPFMPFITEEIWQNLPEEARDKSKSIVVSSWPVIDDSLVDEKVEKEMKLVMDIVVSVRDIRREFNVPHNKETEIIFKVPSLKEEEELRSIITYLKPLAKISDFKVGKDVKKPLHSATVVVKDIEVYVPLTGIIDVDKEKGRLEKELKRVDDMLKKTKQKLSNEDFRNKAPKELIEKEESKYKDLSLTRDRVQASLEELK